VATDHAGNREATPTGAQATTDVRASIVTWRNPAGGDWDDAANWDLRVPTADDDVVINMTGITINHAAARADAVHSLTTQAAINLSGGSLSIAAPSVLNALFTVSDGMLLLGNAALNGSGTLVNQGTLVVQGNSTINVPLATVNSSSINVNGGDLTVNLSGTSPSFINNGAINIASGRTFTISGGVLANFNNGTLSGGTYNIAGTFKFPNAAITTNAATIVLDGTGAQIVNQTGVDALTNFATNAAAGSFTVQNGRNFTTAAAVAFSNAGTLAIGAGSTFNVSGNLSNFAGATLTGGTYVIDGTLQFTGANIVTNAATIVLDGTAAQIVDQASNNGLANFASNSAAGSFTIQSGSLASVGASQTPVS
jgi:formylmethanofuran dehydrogenase subunit C